MKNTHYIIILLISVFTIPTLQGQSLLHESNQKNKAYIRYGIEPTTMLTVGFQHSIKAPLLNQRMTLFGEWGLSTLSMNFDNSEMKIGGIINLWSQGNFRVVNNLNFSAGSVSTKHFDSKKFAVADKVNFGLYKENWYLSGSMEYENIYLNHIEHTDFYRTVYYVDAVDGWYKGAGGNFQLGLETGRTFKYRYDLHLEVKVPFTERLNSYGGSPLHVNLGLGYRF